MVRSLRSAFGAALAGFAGVTVVLLIDPTLALATSADEGLYRIVRPPTFEPGDPIPAPDGPVILTVDGRVRTGEVSFDRTLLESLGLVAFTTPTSWTEPSEFEGVLLSRVLDAVGASGNATTLVLVALNDFVSRMPIDDARKWPVMLALKENGRYMPIRRRGPIWVVYPQHANPAFGRGAYLSRWVWQLQRITVE